MFVVNKTFIVAVASNQYVFRPYFLFAENHENGGVETVVATVLERAREGNEWSNDVMWVLFITNAPHPAHAQPPPPPPTKSFLVTCKLEAKGMKGKKWVENIHKILNILGNCM